MCKNVKYCMRTASAACSCYEREPTYERLKPFFCCLIEEKSVHGGLDQALLQENGDNHTIKAINNERKKHANESGRLSAPRIGAVATVWSLAGIYEN